jgi:hypothetical protein
MGVKTLGLGEYLSYLHARVRAKTIIRARGGVKTRVCCRVTIKTTIRPRVRGRVRT